MERREARGYEIGGRPAAPGRKCHYLMNGIEQENTMTNTVSISVTSGVAISAKSTSTTPGDHVGVFNLAAEGGSNNASLNVVSANTAFSACEVSGHELGHGTLKISHVNPGPDATSDFNAAALSIDLQAGAAGGTAAQGIFLKSTTGGTSGKIINFVDSNGATIFALMADGSLLFTPLASPPAGTQAGLKLCNIGGALGVVDSTGAFAPLT
jgi:Hyaluronidase protein (HylP)